MPFGWLLLAFITLPIVEMLILFEVHGVLGLLPTLLLVMGTGFLGAFLARVQGLLALRAVSRDLAEGRVPAGSMLEGVMILAAAVMLVTPGLLTDSVGFLLLVPAVRAWIRTWLGSKLEQQFRSGGLTVWRW